MAKRLSLKGLNEEIDSLRRQVLSLERQVEQKVGSAFGSALARLRGGPAALPRGVTPEMRHRMIAEAAWYRAEARGFEGGDPDQDWLEAEREIDRRLAARGRAEAGRED